jgi:hypothetical protein
MKLAFEKSGARPVNTYYRDGPPGCRQLQSQIASTIDRRYTCSKSAANTLLLVEILARAPCSALS